jgi:hypothetical protein
MAGKIRWPKAKVMMISKVAGHAKRIRQYGVPLVGGRRNKHDNKDDQNRMRTMETKDRYAPIGYMYG